MREAIAALRKEGVGIAIADALSRADSPASPRLQPTCHW
jgi:hypothetical protein